MTVYERGNGWGARTITVKALPNDKGISRFGLSTGKSIGKAVVRNRIKRRLREIVKQTNVKPGWDIVVIARPDAAKTDYKELKKAVEKLLSRAHITSGDNERTSTGTY